MKLRDFLYPRRCPMCDEPVPVTDGLICRTCRDKLVYIGDSYCMRCGKPVPTGAEYCTDCARGDHSFDRGRALYPYDSVDWAIYRLKYASRQEYVDFFAEDLEARLGDFIRAVRPDALVPVPISKQRFRTRGYNQAALLARALGKRMGIPVEEGLVARTVDTAPLKSLSPAERINNLKNAFQMAQNVVQLDRVMLVDDIYTTGATIDEIAATLKSGGISQVTFVTLAIGSGC